MAAAKAAWPVIVSGVRKPLPASDQALLRAASGAAGRLALPPLLGEQQAAALTGPAFGIAGLYRAFTGLCTRSWPMLLSMLEQIEHGPPAAARFARDTVALYVDGIYDAHFSLAQIGKQLGRAYRKLGGAKAFGTALTEGQLTALEQAYSEAANRLEPHVAVTLGS